MQYTAVIALGSNLEKPIEQIKTAITALSEHQCIALAVSSNIYQNPPIGPEQPEYYNAVCLVKTSLNPWQLLRVLQAQEKNQQRVKTEYWGARTIDLDIVKYQHVSIVSDYLHLPHRFACQRRFVLEPWLEIDSNADLLLNNENVKISQLLARCEPHKMIKLAQD